MALWKKPENNQPASQEKSPSKTMKDADGDASRPDPQLSAEQLRQMAQAAKSTTAVFGAIISLLMRVPAYRNHSLSDLEWLVAPALLTGQFSLTTAQSKSKGLTAAVGVVLWANVSDDIDKRLSAAPGQPIRLLPSEWKSGENPWIVVAAGDEHVVQGILKQLHEKHFTKRPAKLHVRKRPATAQSSAG